MKEMVKILQKKKKKEWNKRNERNGKNPIKEEEYNETKIKEKKL